MNGTEVVLKNGSYAVLANSISKNYTYAFSPECSEDIKNGQGKICVVTADDLLNENNSIAKLIVVHRIINNDGLGRAPVSFASTVTGNCLENCSIMRYNESLPLGIDIREYHMEEGNYQVSYQSDDDYSISASNECNDHIRQGEVKTCQLTIDDKPHLDLLY